MTTLPALSSVNNILDNDLILVEHSNGEGFKMTGADLKNIMKAQAVDTVALNNMQSVTSNAVATALNEKLNKDYWTLFTGQAPSSQQIMNTYESRKSSDYNFIIFVVGSDSQNTRTTIILPREVFTSGERVYLYAHGSGMVTEVDVSYKSDTEFYMQQDLSTGNPFTPYVRIYGI